MKTIFVMVDYEIINDLSRMMNVIYVYEKFSYEFDTENSF